MAFKIRRVDYFYTNVDDLPCEAYGLLNQVARLGINLLAFTAVPIGPTRTQLTMFPDDSARLQEQARKAGIVLDGLHPAILVQGDDELGALARVHERFCEAGVNVYASSGVADGRGSFGYVLYVRPQDLDRTASVLES